MNYIKMSKAIFAKANCVLYRVNTAKDVFKNLYFDFKVCQQIDLVHISSAFSSVLEGRGN